MTPESLRAYLAKLGLSQLGLARLVGADGRTVRRWAKGDQPVPRYVPALLIVMDRARVTVTRLEQWLATEPS